MKNMVLRYLYFIENLDVIGKNATSKLKVNVFSERPLSQEYFTLNNYVLKIANKEDIECFE